TDQQKLDIIRVYHVLFNRFGQPTADERKAWLAKFSPVFPDKNRFVNGELLQVFVYLQDDTVAPKGMQLLKDAPTQEEQLEYVRGRKAFAVAKCFACHRYDNEGGSNGPDLTGVAGRFSPRDLLESVLDPSKEISDQYAAVEIRTKDERIVIGRIVNLNNDQVMVNPDMMNPGLTVSVDRKNIESMKQSKISMMPAGLLDTFKEDEILDLLAYSLSRGDRTHAMLKQ